MRSDEVADLHQPFIHREGQRVARRRAVEGHGGNAVLHGKEELLARGEFGIDRRHRDLPSSAAPSDRARTEPGPLSLRVERWSEVTLGPDDPVRKVSNVPGSCSGPFSGETDPTGVKGTGQRLPLIPSALKGL